MARSKCLVVSIAKALCILTQFHTVHGWTYAPSGDIVGDNGEDLEWPSEAVLSAQPVLPLAEDVESPSSDEEVGATMLGSPGGVRVMTLGDWGPTTWPPGWVERCIRVSGEWAAGKRAWVPDSCGSSMHHLCDTLGEAWRKSNPERCVGNSTLWLREENAQKNVAAQMMKLAEAGPKPKFVLSVGDNFYWAGVTDVRSGEFSEKFEKVYRCPPLCAPFITALGNHDYGGNVCDKMFGGTSNTSAQIAYDKLPDWQHPQERGPTRRWVMPDRYYKKRFRFEEGVSIDVFVLDTNFADSGKNCGQRAPCPKAKECMKFFADLQTAWEKWLPTEFEESTANWRVVIGHHPFTDIPSILNGGPQDYGGQRFMEMLAKGGAALYVAGHVHQSRLDRVVIDGTEVHHIVTGAGGGYQNAGGSLDPTWSRYNVTTEWAYIDFEPVSYGFSSLYFTPESVEVAFVNDLGDTQKTYTIQNPNAYRGSWQASDWEVACDNSCGSRNRTRTLGCSSGFEPECDPSVRPDVWQVQRCYAYDASKLVAYCDDCTGRGACSRCLDRFEWKAEAARCENVQPFAVANWSLTCVGSRTKLRCGDLSAEQTQEAIKSQAELLAHSGPHEVQVFLIDSGASFKGAQEVIVSVSLGFSYTKVLDFSGMQALAKHMAGLSSLLAGKIPGASSAASEGLTFYDIGLRPVPMQEGGWRALDIALIVGCVALVVGAMLAVALWRQKRSSGQREATVSAPTAAPSEQVEMPTR